MANDVHDDVLDDDTTYVDPMDDPNGDDFSDLWDNDPAPEDEADDQEGTEGDPEEEDSADGTQDSGDGGETGDEPVQEGETGDEEDIDPNESEIELDLIEGYDEDLVNNVETLAISEQLYLDIEKVKEIFDGSPESYDKLMAANKEAMNNTAINNVYEMLPQRGKDFFDYLIKTNGAGDLDGWLDLERREADLSSIDLESMTEEQAKIIIKADHNAKGLSDKQSKYILEAHEDNADLMEEAKNLHKASATKAATDKAAKLASDAAAAAAAQAANIARQKNVVKAINSTKFSTQKQEEIFNLIYTNDASTGNTVIVSRIADIIQNKPEHLVQLAMLFDGYDEEEGFNNKRLKNQIKSDTVKKTKATIKRKTKPASRGRQTSKDKLNHKAGIDDWLSDVEL